MYIYSYSEKQLKLYEFLRKVGAAPEAALQVLFGKKTFVALEKLKRHGYIQKCKGDWWKCPGYFFYDTGRQETLAWFVARLEESGGRYEGSYGISPKGNKFALEFFADYVLMNDLANNRTFRIKLEDLRVKKIRDCLEK